MGLDSQILNSWQENADTWNETIDGSAIPSRKFTNPAVINCIKKHIPNSILDIGCGEGWLSRKLSASGFEVFGLDGTESLIHMASQKAQSSNYALATFQDLVDWSNLTRPSPILYQIQENQYQGAVLNFCLYEKKGISDLLQAVQKLIASEGKIIIQTIHPFSMLAMGLPYKSQWMEDSWKGLTGNFRNGHPWYFRTVEDWLDLFKSSSSRLEMIYEPINTETNLPASIIFVLG